MAMAMCGPRTAPTGEIVERAARTGQDGRNMQGKRSGLAVIGWLLEMDMTLGQTRRELCGGWKSFSDSLGRVVRRRMGRRKVSWHRLLAVCMMMRGLMDANCSSASVHRCNS